MRAKFLLLIFTGFLCMNLTSCIVVKHHKHPRPPHREEEPLPPGHAKKMKGDKSARDYAPGHRW